MKSAATHLLRFKKTGVNKFGASTGVLTLYAQNKAILTASAFSGGNGANAIPNGTFTIRLDIRGAASSSSDLKASGNELKQFYGIQRIAPSIDGGDYQWEWGSVRAALNESPGETRQDYRGNYLHGKVRPGDYTHGCICNRDESVLQGLLELEDVPRIPVEVK